MQNEKDKPPSYYNYRTLLLLSLVALALSVIISVRSFSWLSEYQYGDIARETIKSPADITLPGMGTVIKKGEVVVREGEKINHEHLRKFSLLKAMEEQKGPTVKKVFFLFILLFLAITIMYEYATRNIRKFTLTQKDLIFSCILLVFTAILMKSGILIFNYFALTYTQNLIYVIPIFMFGMIMRIVLFSEAALIFSTFFAIVMAFTFENDIQFFLYAFLGNLLASYFSGKCENRNTILKAGLYTSLLMGFLVLLFHGFFGDTFASIPIKITFVMLSGIVSSFITLGLLPVIEHLFDYTTDIRLLELANLEHPLLEEMMVNAAGTYHHSIIVGNLSKAAAESIGAHPLLTRVSAYYHDIGKLKMPHYFIENRVGAEDAHKALTPNMSALIILSHIKEGVDLAEQYGLGTKITDIIKQHHGTSLLSYFYNRAKELEDSTLHVIEERDFRYSGPKPQTKEAGIIMLADAVEASSRLLEDPTPKRIEKHVQNIIGGIFLDGQLDGCELTLKDLYAIQKSFSSLLIGIFHQRIEYPERTANGGHDKQFPKVGEDRQKGTAKDHGRLTHLFKAAG